MLKGNIISMLGAGLAGKKKPGHARFFRVLPDALVQAEALYIVGGTAALP